MRRHTIKGRLIALALGALFIGLAPLVHALCVAPASSSATMSHTIADGSTMVMATQTATATEIAHFLAPSAPAGSNSAATTFMTETQPLATFGSILVAIGLSILTFFGLRRCAQPRAHFGAQSRPAPRRHFRWPERLALRPYAVSLDSLGINRT